jgi:hypothetical protein
MNPSSVLWLALAFVLSFPRLALAGGANDPDDGCLRDAECRGHYEKAMKSYSGGRYEAALPEFQAAYGQRQMPWLLVNIGRTLHRLGRLEEAVQYYNNYEKASLGSDPETLKKVQEYRTQAQAALDAMKGIQGSGGSTVTPTPVTPSVTPSVTPPTGDGTAPIAASGSDAQKPIYKKWWFWTIVGGSVAAVTILGVGIGVGVSKSSSADPIPSGTTVYSPTF